MCLPLPPTTEKTWQLVETASLSLDTGGDNDGQSNRIHNNANPHQALISWGMQWCFPAPAAWLLYSRHAGKHVAAAQQTCDLQRNHKAPASLGDRCCAHWPHLLPPESKMHPKGNRAGPEMGPPLPLGIYRWPWSAKALSYFPPITSYTCCSNTQDSIVTTLTARITAFPQQLSWSCHFAPTRFASVHTEFLSLYLFHPEKHSLH